MAAEQTAPRYRSLQDVEFFLRALPLVKQVQAIRSRPMPDVVRELSEVGGRIDDPLQARAAAVRAGARYGRWFGGLDTCLTRSLVAGSLLCGAHDVVLHVGFRPGSDEVDVDGHAWLTVDGEKLDLTRSDEDEVPYTEALEISFSAERGE